MVLDSSPRLGAMDTELAAVPLVAVGDRESHHAGAGFEVRHAAGDPMIDGAGTYVEASGDLPLADPGARRPLTDQSRIEGQAGAKNSGTRKPGLKGTHRNCPWNRDRRGWGYPVGLRAEQGFRNPENQPIEPEKYGGGGGN